MTDSSRGAGPADAADRSDHADPVGMISEALVARLAIAYPDLPRPALAVLGAGELAADQWAGIRAELRERSLPETRDELRATTDQVVEALGRRAVLAVTEAGEQARRMVGRAPGWAARMIGDAAYRRRTRVRLEHDAAVVSGMIEDAARLAGILYRGLADQGSRSWSRAAARPGSVVQGSVEPDGHRDPASESCG
ncbi:hypothetical protein [Nakamurella leprariae]|uniref:Uncharacterized protein n=1 Tax=Nakamurella leprariae TaxID=2803911 RepID=A0A938Y5U2_9ACTN|nr:hypothetical protein [Nakamurella leprariae]MBM9466320.1 hypothetical protein [Nakamurella leprariae]